jgi:Spy/CpxP family protein refolding chaperone
MPDSRARVWFALFVLVIFCAGVGGGMVIGRNMGPPQQGGTLSFLHGGGGGGRGRGPGPFGPGSGFGMMRGGGPPAIPPGLVERMEEELKLDDAQRAQVQKILDERRGRLEQIHRDARERFDKEAQALHQAIRAILRPDQQQKFDEWSRRRRQ